MTETEKIALEKIANNEHEIYALLKQRYSPRIFEDKPIAENEMQRLFEAVRWAASSYNRQPWRFVYAHKGSDAYDDLLDCLSDFNQKWAVNAPVLLLAGYKEETDDGEVNFHALHDLGLSLGNMTVQAQYMGIALHHMAGVDWKKAQKVFQVPKGFHIATAIALGYYGGDLDNLNADLQEQEKAKRERMPQHEFAFKGKWQSSETE